HDVAGVRDALVWEVHRRRELLENLTRLRRTLPLDVIGVEHVHRHRQLLRGRVTRARADHDVDRRETDGLHPHRKVVPCRLDVTYGDLDALRDVAEQPHAHGIGARGHAPDFVIPLHVGGRPRTDRVDAHGHARERCSRAVADVTADRRTFLERTAAATAALAWPSAPPSTRRADDLAPIFTEIEKRHDEAVSRLQEWIRQPSIAAENRGVNEGCELTMRLLKDAGFDQVTKIPTDGQPGIVATLDAGAPRTLGLYFMYDVKQADPAEWSSP